MDGSFTVHRKNDGTDYWRLLKACIDEEIDQDALIRGLPEMPEIPVVRNGVDVVLQPFVFSNPKRMVFRVEWEGRVFVLKRAKMGTVGLRHLFPRSTGLTYFTNIMKKVDAAMRNGCWSTQDCYCVAERWLGLFRQECWALFEYVEGRGLEDNEVPEHSAFLRTVEDLLRHGLTMNDISGKNFITDGVTVRAIDISCRPFTVLNAAKMRLKLNARYELGLPMRGVLAGLLRMRHWLRRYHGTQRRGH
jgi:hypothetical protein